MGVKFQNQYGFLIGGERDIEVNIYKLEDELNKHFAFPLEINYLECWNFQFRNKRFNWASLLHKAERINEDSNDYNAGIKWLAGKAERWLERNFPDIRLR